MLNKLLTICWVLVSSAYFYRPFVKKVVTLEAIKIIDHNMKNKTVYDKYEYYGLLGDVEKQRDCLLEILNMIKNKNDTNNNND